MFLVHFIISSETSTHLCKVSMAAYLSAGKLCFLLTDDIESCQDTFKFLIAIKFSNEFNRALLCRELFTSEAMSRAWFRRLRVLLRSVLYLRQFVIRDLQTGHNMMRLTDLLAASM